MMRNGIMLGGRFYELVETTDVNECCGCAFCERCNTKDLQNLYHCYYITQLCGDVIAIGHHFEEKSTK